MEAIFTKFKRDKKEFKDFPLILEAPIYEIIGFYYSVLPKSTEFYKFYKLHNIDILNDNDFTAHINKNNNRSILNIMPLLFDGHISILFFIDANNKRYFRLSDPSHIHSKYNGDSCLIDPFIFNSDMRKYFDLVPKNKIQRFNSCSLWFYFQILTLLNYNKNIQNKKYTTVGDFIRFTDNSIFYFDCLNYYMHIVGFGKKLIEIKPKELFEEEDFFYIIPDKSKRMLDIVKNNIYSFLNQFIDIISITQLLTSQNFSSKPCIKELNEFMEKNEEFIDFISLINYNINFFDLSIKKDPKIIKDLEALVTELEDERRDFVDICVSFLFELAKISNFSQELIKYDSKEVKMVYKEPLKIMESINENIRKFNEKKTKIESKYALYPLKITGKILFPIIGVLYRSK